MELNAESILDALNDFERKPTEIPPILEEYLLRIAQNGEIIFPWCKLKPLLKRKLEVVLDEFYESCPVEISVPVPNFETFNFDTLKKTILQAVDSFTSAPFTIQRLCELVTNPKKHYNRTDKYMRGIEKNVLVVSTIEPRLTLPGDGNNANVNPVVNGLLNDTPRDDSDCFNAHDNANNVSSSNLNASSNHVLLENFANVFPSAACIPSASNICMNREIDSNFLSTSECVETQEVEFEPSVSSEQTESSENKTEEMDTTEEQNFPLTSCEVTSADAENSTPDENSAAENSQTPKPEKLPKSVESAFTEDEVSDSKAIKSEADCSESSTDTITPVQEPISPGECPQDGTVSQSDDSLHDDNKISQSDKACDDVQSSSKQGSVTDVSQSTASSDLSSQSMELESSSDEVAA